MDIIHIFGTPFYFIEYAIAQVAALQLYKKYKQNPEQTLTRFKKALALGSSKPIKEVYEEAGIEFNVSKENIREVMTLIRAEIAMP
ncbi:M3 family oligoendopeptidase [Bacillus sp. RO3]|nr:M3 family oligoendopeptidase [Bacillus sp. RO3]